MILVRRGSSITSSGTAEFHETRCRMVLSVHRNVSYRIDTALTKLQDFLIFFP